MYELPLILAAIGFFALIIIVFNIFFIYQPILTLNAEIQELKAEIANITEKFEPQIQLIESLISGV